MADHYFGVEDGRCKDNFLVNNLESVAATIWIRQYALNTNKTDITKDLMVTQKKFVEFKVRAKIINEAIHYTQELSLVRN